LEYINKLKSDSLAKLAIFICIFAAIYLPSYKVMVSWWEWEDYNYCYLIPFVVIYLLWEKRAKLFAVDPKPSWYGLIPLIIGVIFYWLGELGGEYYTLFLSSWLVLVALVWMIFGFAMIKVLLFPLCFMLTMFPLPDMINNQLTIKLKLISSQIGVEMMQAFGMSAYREGNIIDLGFTQLQVVDACSGLRYLFPLLILSILMSYFFRSAFWKKIVLVVSSVPLTIITNSLRIAMTGFLFELWGPRVAHGFFHGFSGWFIFMFGLVVLLIEMWALSLLGRSKAAATRSDLPQEEKRHLNSEPEVLDQESRPVDLRDRSKKGIGRIFLPPQFAVALLLLVATLAVAQGVEFREKIPANKPLSEFPLRVDQWQGKRVSMEQRFIDTLDLSDYVIIEYKNKNGRTINFYTAYYETQRKGESIHSPASCLPGSGWVFNKTGTTRIPLHSQNNSIPVNQAFMEKSGYRQLSYYWFPQRGRILTNAYQLKIYTFWDALTRQRTDGALVRVITPVYKDEGLSKAENRLQSFVQEIQPVLNEFLPD
jgi:exosortase D (VPLPA-CTERM-specific)